MSIRIINGDARDVLPTLPAGSVQCCTTSPPYYGLRRYLPEGHPDADKEFGTESTPDEYVAGMVAVFNEVHRVLRDDGVLFLNIGDSYAAGGMGPGSGKQLTNAGANMPRKKAPDGIKPKDLLGIPWMLAFALRADGWWLRSDIIWAKPNPMPESVTDRPTNAHEHVFLLTKSARYFYDADAVAEAASDVGDGRRGNGGGTHKARLETISGGRAATHMGTGPNGTRNLRNVWTIATTPFSGAHFATFPPELAERCIKAGSRPGDTILDPFSGAGTTALCADRLGRDAIGIELNPAYADMSHDRVTRDAGLFAQVSA